MKTEIESAVRSADSLRSAFDRSFAEAPREAERLEEYLAIRVGGVSYAVCLFEIAGIHRDRVVVPMPAPFPGLAGLAGFGGAIVPVYELAELMGQPGPHLSRWLLLGRPPANLALAFSAFEGLLRAPPEAFSRTGAAGGPRFTSGVLECDGERRPVVAVGEIVEGIARRLREGGSPGGR